MGLDPDEEMPLHVTMAGAGDAFAHLTPIGLQLLRGLHNAKPLFTLAASAGLSADQIEAELLSLRHVHLLTDVDGFPRPAFLIATIEEARRIDQDAAAIGHSLAIASRDRWGLIERGFRALTVATTISFHDLGFLLVGGKLLDVGLLDALAREGTLMPPAPTRPSPAWPDARYYLWAIEGPTDLLSRYGQRTTGLPWQGWELVTFGQYAIDGIANLPRSQLEKTGRDLAQSGYASSPTELANQIGIPLVDERDVEKWREIVAEASAALLTAYHDHRRQLHLGFETLRASDYLANGFGEFVCWYHHLAYAHAIDELIREGLLSMPSERFSGAIWHEVPYNVSF